MPQPNETDSTHHRARVGTETVTKPSQKLIHPLLFFCFLIGFVFLGIQQYLAYFNIIWVPFGVALGITLPAFVAIVCLYA